MAENNVEAMLISDPENVRWATGFTGSFGYAIILPEGGVFLTDSRYTLQAQEEVKELESASFSAPKTGAEFLKENIINLGISKLGFERGITYSTWEDWSKELNGVELTPAPDILTSLRMVKSHDEIEKVRAACKLADACLEHIERLIQPGVTEFDIGLEIEFFYRRNGAGIAFSPIVASGPNSARPHARATERKLEVGDFVTIDCGGTVDGYNSDITRTFVVVDASERQREIYSRVLEAQVAAIEAIKPGAIAGNVDALAREILDKDGLAKYFGHGLGHGLGRSVHDFGRLGTGSETKLEPGQIWTVEPGVYIEGFGGVRIEDDVVVTQDGCEVLTHYPKDLMIFPR